MSLFETYRYLPFNFIDNFHIFYYNFRTIISSSQFFDTNNSDLKVTNMFVLLKPRDLETFSYDDNHLTRRDNFAFSANCRTTIFNIENHDENISLNCCRDLDIYSESVETSASTASQDDSGENASAKTTNDLTFYECKVFVKGFKEQSIKGRSVWSS